MEEKGKSSSRNKTKTLKLAIAWTGIAVLLVSIAMAVTFLAVTPVIAQEATVTVTVNAPEYVEEGGTFVATIDVDSVTDLNSAQFDISFDSDVVKVTDVEDGEIGDDDVSVYDWCLIPGKDIVRVIVQMSGGEGVSGSGYLAKIKFAVKEEEVETTELKFTMELEPTDPTATLELTDINAEDIPASWIDAEITVGVEEEEEEEEEAGEEVTVTPGSPNITACKPAEAVVSNAVGESRTFNITVNQIADIGWQINGTEVQTNESVTEAVFTNTSAVIGIWNVSAIATNTTTGLSDMHTWIWGVTHTPVATVTPTPTLAHRVTPTPEAETEVTPTPQEKKIAPKEKATPVPAATPTPKPAVPGFEAIFAIAVILGITYRKMRKGKNLKKIGGEYKR